MYATRWIAATELFARSAVIGNGLGGTHLGTGIGLHARAVCLRELDNLDPLIRGDVSEHLSRVARGPVHLQQAATRSAWTTRCVAPTGWLRNCSPIGLVTPEPRCTRAHPRRWDERTEYQVVARHHLEHTGAASARFDTASSLGEDAVGVVTPDAALPEQFGYEGLDPRPDDSQVE